MNPTIALFLALSLAAATPLSAEEALGTLLFKDDFERTESQEETDEPGNGWGTNSKSRANGNKQVDLKDGTMRIFIHETADHGVSVTHPAEFTDGAVGLRFLLEDGKDSLGLNFADQQYKAVHAGHLFAVRISPREVKLEDLKTGRMDKAIRDARQADKLSDEQKALLKTKETKIPHKLAVGEWHHLLVEIRGQKLTATIDGKVVGSFESEGIAHPTKRMLRLAVPRNAVVDDLKIWRKK